MESNGLEFMSDDMMEEYMRLYHVPGTAVACVKNAQICCQKVWGDADRKQSAKLNEHTTFQVASISKCLTAWGVMRLVEMGEITVDKPARMYLKSFEMPPSRYENEITVRQLLSHTAGLSQQYYLGYSANKPVPSLREALNSNRGTDSALRVIAAPGRQFIYSGGGYGLLQLIIEDITGMNYADYMPKYVLHPLNMLDAHYWIYKNPNGSVASPHTVFGKPAPLYSYCQMSAAGLYASVSDLANFLWLTLLRSKSSYCGFSINALYGQCI